ncbi:juvenile hormone acid O-methyltransferase-like [Stegodyphus dumicola]|uniref:juvenile hormone acid O-methyltransferase-like n=1 Tax=Stegodyphus dumicola TaxID=202533 RepID=UPI0015ADB518|nr:juvenile hormone acid O-methyltransferase-like [Stegodyphus dumicola]
MTIPSSQPRPITSIVEYHRQKSFDSSLRTSGGFTYKNAQDKHHPFILAVKHSENFPPYIRQLQDQKMNDPELYARASPFQIRDANHVLKDYQNHMMMNDSDVVLDIGCGTGDVTTRILSPAIGRFELLLGVDKSPEMVQYAKQHYEDDNIQYDVLDIAGDVTEFREDWGTFSKIFSFYCLHWVKDLRKALSNIQHLMQPGGECLLVFVAQCPVFEMYERMAKMSKWQDYMEDVNVYVPDTQHMTQPSFTFSQMMEDAGIISISCSTLHRSFAFTSTKMLTDCMVAVNPFIKRIPFSEREAFIEDSIKTLAAIKLEKGNANENESCCFTYKLLVAHGTKNQFHEMSSF